MRFDEVELQSVPLEEVAATQPATPRRSLVRHGLAILIDLSLFVALALALSPFLPQPASGIALTALGGFLLMLSFYYFVGAWMLWGKTVGGAIFDVRVEARTLRQATLRWASIVGAIGIVGALVTVATL
jgi:uncharacterized RDD family membrane protein YckC